MELGGWSWWVVVRVGGGGVGVGEEGGWKRGIGLGA